jgi:hypothetical protein
MPEQDQINELRTAIVSLTHAVAGLLEKTRRAVELGDVHLIQDKILEADSAVKSIPVP